MDTPKSNQWRDGRQEYLWPVYSQIGWAVQTAGRVDLDLVEPKNVNYNQGKLRILPAKTVIGILKHVDYAGKAFVYSTDHGVVMVPQELLEPVGK